MTAFNDFDRVLGEWLEDGPNRAPDRSVELAVDYARAHPRGRDPLRFLRRDPMARSSGGLALRPVLVLAALGLLLAAVAALGIGGPKNPAVVLPSSPITTPVPVSPAPTPVASVAAFHVALTVPAGQAQTVDVIDSSGLLLEATSGTPTGENGQSFPFESVVVSNLDPTTLQLGWAGYPCETVHTLTIESDGRTMSLKRPDCAGVTDSIGIDRILVLRFSKALAAADVEVPIVP